MTSERTLVDVRRRERDIAKFFHLSLAPKIVDSRIRSTRHFREWFFRLMNYNRIMEIPLACELLEVENGDSELRVLDLSSPKLMALYLSSKGHDVVASDIDDYFVNDFEVFAERLEYGCSIAIFDATEIPYPSDSFDRVFSVSALEHIPGSGDSQALKEVCRVLRPGGIAVITLPAFGEEVEEWLADTGSVYWTDHSEKREDGRTFFQRRYSAESISRRFAGTGLEIDQVVWIAERPLDSPRFDPSGRLLHNVYFIEDAPLSRVLNSVGRWLPLVRYPRYRTISKRTHYLTSDSSDPNVRQVGIQFRKPSLPLEEPTV